MTPSPGFRAIGRRRLAANPSNCGHLGGGFGGDRRISWNKARSATNNAGPDRTCHHTSRTARSCRTHDFPSGKAFALSFGSRGPRISCPCRLGGSLPVAQLSAGRRRASKGGKPTIRRLMALGFGLRSPQNFYARVCSAKALVTCLGRLCFANHRRDKPKFTGHLHCIGGMLAQIPGGASAW